MNIRRSRMTQMSLGFGFLLITMLAGCAAKKALWGDPETGLILEYRMPSGQVLKYRLSSQINQNMEVMGQEMETEMNAAFLFSVKSKGLDKKNHRLDVSLDSMEMHVSSPQGEISPDVSSIVGKSFDLTLSPLGRELDLSGAEELKYDLGPSGKRSIVSEFKTLFPDMAGRPVKIGDSWTSKDTIDIEGGPVAMRMLFESVNTLAGFEKVNDLECVKVTANVTGTLDGEGSQGPADLSFEGDIEGSDTWYFAYKQGIFVKSISEGLAEATVSVSGPQEMTIPMTMETKFQTELVK